MKRIVSTFAVLVALCLCLGALVGCSAGDGNASTQQDTSKLSVVCTTFPSYDWARQIIGEHTDAINLELLLDDGVDLHSYQPTVEDIAKVGSADLLVYVGGTSDTWVTGALQNATNPNLRTVSLMDCVGSAVREEEVVEGMQGEEDSGNEEASADETEYDEHVWLSLRNAQLVVEAMAAELEATDPANAQDYAANARDYCDQLASLDTEYQSVVDSARTHTVLFGDRFPFRYLIEDYGLTYYAAFVGCSAETEASFDTVTFLSSKVDELGLPAVLVIENSDQKIAKTIVDNTKTKDQQILVMDSLQSTAMSDVEAGVTYLSAMKQNLQTLSKALG
ncbi:MAG: metal ABC transporter substrate-binding protein [Coriobacteriales bacterium]|nr:metal ABC transporter substrate-binding protein [Coriobacteriales bacterium]